MTHPDLIVTVAVGFTVVRPVIPDQHVRRVVVAAQTAHDATLTAAQIVACHPDVEMVTSTTITRCVI